jgi:hypothetical protein
MVKLSPKRPAIAVLTSIALTACGGSGGGLSSANQNTPPAGSYNLQAAVAALVKSGLTANVNLSGTVIANGISTSFTGTGTLTLSPGANGVFNGLTETLQTQSISGTVTVAGNSKSYTSSVVNAYDGTAAFLGQSSSSEFDVASAPITMPTTVGTSATTLGTLSRYTDSTRSVVLGTTQVSVALQVAAPSTGSPEVVQFTYKVLDTNQALVETDTFSYNLTENSTLSFYAATVQNASGSLTATPR